MKDLIKCQFQDLGDEWWCVKLPSKSSKAGQYIVGISVSRGEWQAYAALTDDKAAIDDYEIDPMASAEELKRVGATKLEGIVDRGYGDVMCFEVVPNEEYFIQNLEMDNWFCGLFLGTEDEVHAYIDSLVSDEQDEVEVDDEEGEEDEDDDRIDINGVQFSRNKKQLLKVPKKAAGTFVIPDGVEVIGQDAFENCKNLTSVKIPNGVTSIGFGAFYGCKGLTDVTIPDSVTDIGVHAFGYCSSLKSVTIPDGVTRIEINAFHDCSSLTSVTIPDSVTSIRDSAFAYCGSLASIRIPDSVTSIGNYAFYSCHSLKSITIGNGVKTIGDQAFQYCSGLTSVTIPDSVKSISKDAFFSCDNLETVRCSEKIWNAFRRCFPATARRAASIRESTKITLTLGQLKRLVGEARSH